MKILFFILAVGIYCIYANQCPEIDSHPYPTLLPHPYDCTLFIKCHRGEEHIMECPFSDRTNTTRLRFNATISACDWPQNVPC
ncbi:hypothetical protein PVAND_015869 [Polypedilum vanderplanki]|uniref:Chitin-binding type-2 domain-containing protein n=1 Tax=Polypedilum vanderplanki TaxID=319348 RepID=A0A9J6BE73_POLVA|nr:hypothetical protein PVAND_015869 [Polypedilum vanderplanki]